ncbi:ketoacyl-ACP synthase III [Streptomyces sp. NPDC090301]|uniref:ketoacyl-ACP synthase III n=1 Tax=Streptomyces sp. NPDC090301 TaxID=3154975 RepID=UPI00344163ED
MSKIKPSKGAPYARILGVGGYRPTRVVPNEVILEKIDSSDEWIRSRSGIATRHWASPEETVAAMSVEASGKAIADAGIAPEQIGAVIVSTVSHFKQTPAVATEIADKIGAGKPAAFDISAGCAGFGYGLTLAKGMVVEGSAEYVLVIGVERLSDLTDLEDRATAFLFGDGAGAVVVGPSDEPHIGPTVWGSEGDKSETIKQTVPWNEFHPQALGSARAGGTPTGDVSNLPLDSNGEIKFPAITQEGQAVFRWAVFEMAKVAQQALDAAGIAPDDLDVFIPHQANMRIIDSMVKTLKLPEHVTVARDVETTGNTSAASIPLAMERLLATGKAKSGDTALIIGFGAGLVFAATVVTLP